MYITWHVFSIFCSFLLSFCAQCPAQSNLFLSFCGYSSSRMPGYSKNCDVSASIVQESVFVMISDYRFGSSSMPAMTTGFSHFALLLLYGSINSIVLPSKSTMLYCFRIKLHCFSLCTPFTCEFIVTVTVTVHGQP